MIEWIGKNNEVTRPDLVSFKFLSDQPCEIDTINIRWDASGEVEVLENSTRNSGTDYMSWINQSHKWPEKSTITLIIHQRLEGKTAKATSLPYSEENFTKACGRLYQHRSVGDASRRISPAIFSNKTVTAWKSVEDWGPAVVYNCKSDTMSPGEENDMVLSVTHFPKKSRIFAVAYGCTPNSRDELKFWFLHFRAFASHPLLTPMLWAELERRRLLESIEANASLLWKRIVNMENRLASDDALEVPSRKVRKGGGTRVSSGSNSISDDVNTVDSPRAKQREITQRECAAVRLWVDVNTLKNGLESFKAALSSMLESAKAPLEDQETLFGLETTRAADEDFTCRHAQDRTQRRLREMMAELDSKIRRIDGLLGGMGLATQAESNYLSRRDALTNIHIAVESKKDSSHMRFIALLGMIFLPGTFFATLFSTTFFNWDSQDSKHVVSPYIAIYFAFAVVSTTITIWRFYAWANERDDEARRDLASQLESQTPINVSLTEKTAAQVQ